MAISVMSRVWEHSQAGGTELLLLLAIADYSDERGYAYPSVPTLSRKIRMSSRNTQYLLQKLEASGELEIKRGAGRGGSNLYRVKILHPPANLAPCSPLHPTPETGFTPPLKPTSPEPSLTINEPSKMATKPRTKREKRAETTLADRMAQCKAQGIPVVPADSAAIRFAQDAGIPDEFLELAWRAFVSRYTEDQPHKVYADWAQVFTNAVKGNWLKLWFVDKGTGQYQLTTAGLQEQNVQKARSQ
jgi:hypothetical protein